jgi:hypothetical protein
MQVNQGKEKGRVMNSNFCLELEVMSEENFLHKAIEPVCISHMAQGGMSTAIVD